MTTQTRVDLPKPIRAFLAEVAGQDSRVANRIAGYLEGKGLSFGEGVTLVVDAAHVELPQEVKTEKPHSNGVSGRPRK